MPRKGRSNEEIIHALHQVEGGEKVTEVCRRLGVSEQTFYRWKAKYAGMDVPDARRLKQLEAENAKLKKMLAEKVLEVDCSRRLSEKSCEASCTVHPGGVGADGLPSQPTPGREAHSRAQGDAAVPVDTGSPRGAAPTPARARSGPRAVRVSTVDGAVEARRLARECETDLPAVRR